MKGYTLSYSTTCMRKIPCLLNKDALCVLVTQSCLTLCDPLDYARPGSSVHRILQARILERAAIPFSREDALSSYKKA